MLSKGDLGAAAFLAGIFVIASSPAAAAGFWLYELGTPDLGTAAAGRAASAKGAATVFGHVGQPQRRVFWRDTTMAAFGSIRS